jgi:hypothetical protein
MSKANGSKQTVRLVADAQAYPRRIAATTPLNVRFTPKKRTLGLSCEMSALCQKQTYAVQQTAAKRLAYGASGGTRGLL